MALGTTANWGKTPDGRIAMSVVFSTPEAGAQFIATDLDDQEVEAIAATLMRAVVEARMAGPGAGSSSAPTSV